MDNLDDLLKSLKKVKTRPTSDPDSKEIERKELEKPDKYSNNLERSNANDYKKEFLKRMHEFGINLDEYQIAIGYKTDEMYYRGIYKDNGKWVAYRVGDRNRVSISYEDNEKDAYQYI